MLALHFAQITLRIHGENAFLREQLHHFQRKVICQQASEMEESGLLVFQFVGGERIGFCKHTLRPFVLIFSVGILEKDRMFAWQHFHLYALLSHLLHGVVFAGSQCRYELVVFRVFKMLYAV